MKELYRRVKTLIVLIRVIVKVGLPSWVVLVLADSIRRGGNCENFHHEIVKLQQKGFEIQKSFSDSGSDSDSLNY
jgi:hypothetical protein